MIYFHVQSLECETKMEKNYRSTDSMRANKF